MSQSGLPLSAFTDSGKPMQQQAAIAQEDEDIFANKSLFSAFIHDQGPQDHCAVL
ncbi:hypothetical protein [Aeromonas veronii]|uniref:hypothetical protein n=1 Tax=Aeromonas veronii TaxID=654 RepID=UPI003BA07737